MSKKKLTLMSVNDKINRLQKQVTKLRNMLFEWGKKDREDIDKILKSQGEKLSPDALGVRKIMSNWTGEEDEN
jgi:DNA relaxase NicK